ncbi:MAG: hypothetical protein HN348_29225 [Proteobacteria bacterium]|nr:hypothetical protein [Pseudomonadota bacterium]
MATLFRDVLGCQDALYLDGLVSGFYSADGTGNNGDGKWSGILAVSTSPTLPNSGE